MTSNPYAHPETQDTGYSDPPRVSALAISSLVLALICCLPGPGLIGAILGGVAIVRISQARGRLSGRGLAISGLVLGLLTTLLWVGVIVGLALSLNHLNIYGETLRALDQRDYNQVRQMLTPAASTTVTDERLEEFRGAVEQEWGGYQRMPKGVADWIGAYMQVGQMIGRQQQQQQLPAGASPLPLPVYYDNGLALCFFILDPNSPSPLGAAQSSNIVFIDQRGNAIELIPAAAPSVSPPAAPTRRPPPTPPAEPPTETPGAAEPPPAPGGE